MSNMAKMAVFSPGKQSTDLLRPPVVCLHLRKLLVLSRFSCLLFTPSGFTSVFVLQSSLFCFCAARCILPRGCSKTISQDKPQPFYSSSQTLQRGCQRGAILLSEYSGHLLASEKPGSLRQLSAPGHQGFPFFLLLISSWAPE